MEDTCGQNYGQTRYVYEHGFSIYVETSDHRILVDAGASDAFLDNAQALGVDLTRVDTMVLSHGHYDHAGGIRSFSRINPTAAIYMQKTAGDDYFHNGRYIGIDKRIMELPQVHVLDGDLEIDSELSVFSHITGRRFWPKSNLALKKRVNGIDQQDEFAHEQCLVITQGEERILLSGCAHNGILNILDRFKEKYGGLPQMVISGFHMMKKTEYSEAEVAEIRQTAEELAAMDTVFYTGHCTGQEAIRLMKPIMGDKLRQICSGMVLRQ